ncbi:hypothetical protein PTET_a0943 [Pseudoalteromonas tetraodonis]|nr:hypothetical protein PTET_a0943 [Pseudoalteromonas tetraodonis]
MGVIPSYSKRRDNPQRSTQSRVLYKLSMRLGSVIYKLLLKAWLNNRQSDNNE